MNYIDFTVTGFLSDASFREWVLSPNAANKLYWEDWCRKHPGQQEEIALARQLVAHEQMRLAFLPQARVDSLWAAIEAEVGAGPSAPLTPAGPAGKIAGSTACGSLMAAVFLGLLVTGLALYQKNNRWIKSL
jgi:hypothetical protein